MSDMPAKYRLPEGRYTCAAAHLNMVVTNELSAEAQSASLGGARPGSEAQNERVVYTQQCVTCCGSVAVHGSSFVTAEKCDVSSSCGKSAVALYPEGYVDERGEPKAGKFPCGGFACNAVLRLGCTDGELYASDRALGQIMPERAWCKVDVEGDVYAREGRHALDGMAPDEYYEWDRNDGIEVTEGLDAPLPLTAEPTAIEGWHAL